MRILILTQWFDPEPAAKGLSFARRLAERGHTVEILTGFPNYPGGKVYPGYRVRPWQVEWMEGIRVCRVALYPSHDRSAVRRALNYLSFALASALLGSFLTHRPDVIYVYHPPATTGLAALVLRWWFAAPVVYDVQDLWPDTIRASGMLSNRRALSILDRVCGWLYRSMDRVTVLSPGFRGALIARGVAPEKIAVIYNWCEEAALAAGAPEASDESEFQLLFAGTMGFAQALDAVLDAARICARTVPEARFVFAGGGVDRERLERRAREMALANVRFLPRQPMSEMGRFLSAADALLVHLKDDPLFRITIPSKTQAYLAVGRPILMGVRGDAAALITRAGAGIVCEPGNPRSIAAGVAELAHAGAGRREAMGRAGREFYQRELSMAAGSAHFERVFEEVAG